MKKLYIVIYIFYPFIKVSWNCSCDGDAVARISSSSQSCNETEEASDWRKSFDLTNAHLNLLESFPTMTEAVITAKSEQKIILNPIYMCVRMKKHTFGQM